MRKKNVMSAQAEAVINMRAKVAQRDLIDRAAKATHKTRTEFVLDAATIAAQNALMDKREFILDENEYRAFVDKLRAPVAENQALVRLLEEAPPWER